MSISSLVGALGIVFVWYQTRLLRRQLAADHERSRRELTLNLLQHWNSSITPVTAAAEKIVHRLNDEQCRELANLRSFKLSATHRPLLETCLSEVLGGEELKPVNDQIELTEKQVTRLHFLISDYLNETEAVILGWHQSIADRDIIEREFSFLYDEAKGKDALTRYRKASGGHENYPALEKFMEALRERKQSEGPPRRAPVA